MNPDKKHMHIHRMLSSIYEYFGVFGKPIPMNVISARFSKALDKHGDGFHQTLLELEMNGSIRIELKKTGGKVLYPGKQGVRHE